VDEAEEYVLAVSQRKLDVAGVAATLPRFAG
jgi:hypothetical protein